VTPGDGSQRAPAQAQSAPAARLVGVRGRAKSAIGSRPLPQAKAGRDG
jgi:hypothetical protein